MDALSGVTRGALGLARAVSVTHGPRSGVVVLDRAQGLLVTKDGATVAREWSPEDPLELLGARALADACKSVSRESGDGTTSTAIIGAALLRGLHKMALAGYDPANLAAEVGEATLLAIAAVREASEPVLDRAVLKTILLSATNGDEDVSEALAEACDAVGTKGAMVVRDGIRSDGIELEFKEGLHLDTGHARLGVEPPDPEGILDGPLVALVRGRLSTLERITPILEEASQFQPRPLILVAEDIYGDALTTIALNLRKGVLTCVPLIAPGPGFSKREMLKDIAALSGATIVDPSLGMPLDSFDPAWFGSLRTALVGRDCTTLVAYEDKSILVQARVAELQVTLEGTESTFERDLLSKRVAALVGGLCIIHVGGVTEVSRKERRGRIEDAIRVSGAALAGGFVPGAGQAFLAAARACPKTRGGSLLADALREIVRSLARSSRQEAAVALDASDGGPNPLGWDVFRGTARDAHLDPPIRDATLVVLSSIRAASSFAMTMARIGAAIIPSRRTP